MYSKTPQNPYSNQQDEKPTIPIIKREGQVLHPTTFAAAEKLAILKREGLLDPIRNSMKLTDRKYNQPPEVFSMSQRSQETIDKILKDEPIEDIDAIALSFVFLSIAGAMIGDAIS